MSDREAGDDLPPYSPRIFRWFHRYLRRYFRKNFTAVRSRGLPEAPWGSSPVAFYTNHPAWWDPIHFMLLHRHVMPKRRMYGPFEKKALEQYGFFKRIGAFGVDLESRQGAVDFLRTSRAVLARPDAALWISAQGRFTDPRERPVTLQPGIAHLARSIPDLVIVPVVVEYPFWNEKNAEALSLFAKPIFTADEPERSTEAWTDMLARRMEAAQDELAALALARDPTPFDILVGGTVGVGGIYDTWRRVRAFLSGRPFDAGHGEAKT